LAPSFICYCKPSSRSISGLGGARSMSTVADIDMASIF